MVSPLRPIAPSSSSTSLNHKKESGKQKYGIILKKAPLQTPACKSAHKKTVLYYYQLDDHSLGLFGKAPHEKNLSSY